MKASSAAAIVVVAIVVFAGLYIVVDKMDEIKETIDPSVDAPITVVVTSNHVLYAADYEVFIDGKSVQKFRLEPLQYYTVNKTVKLADKNSARNVEVKVIATGGGLGTNTDTKVVYVTATNRPTVNLFA